MKRHVYCRVNLMFAVFICLPLIVACLNVKTYHVGRQIPEVEKVAILAGGPHKGLWETFALVIPYTYELRGNLLDITADARLGDHYRWLYIRLNQLDIYLYFLDMQNIVVATARLASILNQSTEDLVFFKRTLTVPDHAVAFSFGYDGAVSEFDESASFSKRPYR